MKKHYPDHVRQLMQGHSNDHREDPIARLRKSNHDPLGEAKRGSMSKYKTGGAVQRATGGGIDASNLPPSGNPATARRCGGRMAKGGEMQKAALGGRRISKGMDGHGIRKKAPAAEEMPLKRGGRAHRREHHFWGMLASALAPVAAQGLGKLFGLAEGGQPLKRAMGGAGKVRKGMMTEKGREIK